MRAYTFPTAQSVIDQALAETMGSTASSLTALQTTGLLRRLDSINRDFINAANTRHPINFWSWMEDTTNFQTKSSTTLSAPLTTASTSLTVVTDVGFDAGGGRVWVKTSKGAIDFIDYTSFSGLTASGVTGVGIPHATGEKVEKCYALPSDCAKAHRLLVNTQYYTYQRQELLPYSRTYYTRGSYIVMFEGIGQQDCTFWYEKTPKNLNTGVSATDLANTLDIPVDFQWYAVHRLAAYIFQTRRKEDKAQMHEQQAQDVLTEALSYDANRTTLTQGLQSDW